MDATYQGRSATPDRHPGQRRRAVRANLALLAATVVAGSAAAGASASQTLIIEGAGDGHGVGMSQSGAYGYALHGLGYEAILAHYYTGTTLGQAPAKTIVKVLVGSKVRRVPLEKYVRGVVSAEMPASWPAAALEAQAVASRTYALTAHAGGSRFDVYSDTRSQMYRGAAAETPATNAAVKATAGKIVTYEGKPVPTYFFASSGGMTEDVQYGFPGSEPEPYLVGVPDEYDTGSLYAWKETLSFSAAARSLSGLFKGSFRGIEVLRRGYSPRIVTARVLGSSGSTSVNGPELAGRLGLSSTWAYFSVRSASGSIRQEPDRSGRARQVAPSSTVPPPEPTVSDQGGVAASVHSATPSSSVGATGGVQAP